MGRAFIGNFKGPKGDKGEPGPQGPMGPQGPIGLLNAEGEIEFDDYTSEGVQIPEPETALSDMTSGKTLKILLSNLKAFCMGVLESGLGADKLISDVFSENKSYAAGEYVIYDNIIYRFTTAKQAGGWDSGAVSQVKVAEEIREINGNITALSQRITSFENTKSEIVASALGKALGLAASWTWAQIVAKLKDVVNRGTLNWSGSNTTYSVPAGYYAGGMLDSRASYNAGMAAGKAAVSRLFCAYLGNCPDVKTAHIDLTFYEGYKNLTVNDIYIDTDFLTVSASSNATGGRRLTKSYNAQTGILTLSTTNTFFRYSASYYWPVLVIIKPKYVKKKYPTVTTQYKVFTLDMSDWPYTITSPEQIALEVLDWRHTTTVYEYKYIKTYNTANKVLTITEDVGGYLFGTAIAGNGINVIQIV